MSLYYFSKQGMYGDAKDVGEDTDWQMIIPTGHWNADMWELIHGWADEHRYELARHFSMNIHEMSKGVCKGCTLNEERLDGQYLRGIEPVVTIDHSDWATDAWTINDKGETNE